MSREILVFAALFSIALSMTITQEASALTIATGEHGRIMSNYNPNKVCGNHVCRPGENSKWSSAVLASQLEGPGKATGAQNGLVIMHQIVVNYLVKSRDVNQFAWTSSSMPMHPSMNSTGSVHSNNSTGSMPSGNSTNSMHSNTNSTG